MFVKPFATIGLVGALCLAPPCAQASAPLPDEALQPPPGMNIVLYYNAFANAGSYGQPDGEVIGQHTRINVDIQALHYIHIFNVENVLSGVQVYVLYASFIGGQQVGQPGIPASAGLPAGIPAYGPGHAALSAASGFGQPDARNLAVSAWGEAYFYGRNGNAGLVHPAVYANAIPPIYQVYHELDPAAPAANPLAPQSVTPVSFSMQPTQQLRVYFPYQFFPATHGTIVPGFYQSFGGKGDYTLASGAEIDSGTRTNESQLQLSLSTYLTPHWQIAVNGEYDVMAHGGPLYRTVELRVGTTF